MKYSERERGEEELTAMKRGEAAARPLGKGCGELEATGGGEVQNRVNDIFVLGLMYRARAVDDSLH